MAEAKGHRHGHARLGERLAETLEHVVDVAGMDELERPPSVQLPLLVPEHWAYGGRVVEYHTVDRQHGDHVRRILQQGAKARLAARRLGSSAVCVRFSYGAHALAVHQPRNSYRFR